MKLINQKTLYFSEGNSDKVYEIDLCESQDLFVVNFRYGRRGSNLREGTKTVFPVAYPEAENIFNKLVASKEKKGYSESFRSPKIKTTETRIENSIQKETILKYLKKAIVGNYTRNWKVSKIIARVGVLHIEEALPLIPHFIHSENQFEQYNTIQVLDYFEDASHTDAIFEVFNQHQFKDIQGRIAAAFVLKYGGDNQKNLLFSALAEEFNETQLQNLSTYFLAPKPSHAMLLYFAYMYAFKEDSLRESVYAIAEKIPLKENTFKSIRYMYRASYFLNDAEFFALISKRIALANPSYTSDYVLAGNTWVSAAEEMKKPNPSIAFSKKTKSYFIKNSYKKMYQLSQSNPQTFLDLAKHLLCVLDDTVDDFAGKMEYLFDYNESTERYSPVKKYYPEYYQFLAVMYIVYGNSDRFANQQGIWFADEYNNLGKREEVLSELWNSHPEEVLFVLANAKSDIATNFAVNIIHEKPEILDLISLTNLSQLLLHPKEAVINLTLDFLLKKYASAPPEKEIVWSLIASSNEKAIALGMDWLIAYEDLYLAKHELVVSLLLSGEKKAIEYLASQYQVDIKSKHEIALTQLEDLFASPAKFETDFLLAVTQLFGNTAFGKMLTEITDEKIMLLAESTLSTNKIFAINLAKQSTTPAFQLFQNSYEDYINSEESQLRKAGIEILSHFPDSFLLAQRQNIVLFCFSGYKEVREAIQPTVKRLVKLDSQFKDSLLNQLLLQLTEAEKVEGIHESSYALLQDVFGSDLGQLQPEEIFALVLSTYEFAQKLGTPLFQRKISFGTIGMPELVRLAQSDVLEIRNKLKTYFEANSARINYELETALQVFNSKWQDVIDWACAYFDQHIEARHWTVEVLIYVCDHVKEDVQAFGRKMITTHFTNEKGLPLLQKLQEHPAKSMQFFVTHYLENYAAGQVSVILSLEDYFTTALFYINVHRATKTRVYSFLEKEAVKNREVALMTLRILHKILGSKIKTDRDQVIDILLSIQETYPDVEVPISINKTLKEA